MVQATPAVWLPPVSSNVLSTLCMALFFSCCSWNGGSAKCVVMPPGAAEQRDRRFRRRHRDGERVETRVLVRPKRLRRRHLQEHRLRRHPHRRQRDLVLRPQVAHRFRSGRRVISSSGPDWNAQIPRTSRAVPLRLVPDRDQPGHPAGRHIQPSRNQRIVQHVRAVDRGPGDLDSWPPRTRAQTARSASAAR